MCCGIYIIWLGDRILFYPIPVISKICPVNPFYDNHKLYYSIILEKWTNIPIISDYCPLCPIPLYRMKSADWWYLILYSKLTSSLSNKVPIISVLILSIVSFFHPWKLELKTTHSILYFLRFFCPEPDFFVWPLRLCYPPVNIPQKCGKSIILPTGKP